jgi:hypothetical protein
MISGILICILSFVVINTILQLVASAFNEYIEDSKPKKK